MYMPIIRNKRRKVLFLVGGFLVVFHRSIFSPVILEEQLIAESAQEPQVSEKIASKGNSITLATVTSEVVPVVSEQKLPDQRSIELDKIVQSITTVTEFIGGQQERNRGSGFVVGNRFFTVHHNLTTSFPELRIKSTSFIDDMEVAQPVFSNEEHDVAVFDLPEKLCARHCNSTEVAYTPNLKRSRKVYWLRKFQQDFILKEATIEGGVTFGDAHTSIESNCGSNSVVLVDQPFIPGSSGSPIMDAESGKIIGLIQGSIDEDGVSKGYFKPINCVLSMLEDSQGQQSIARL